METSENFAVVCEGFWCFLQTDWKDPTSLIRGLMLPFFVAGFGAFFGALSASFAARKSAEAQRRIHEFERTNKSAMLAASVCGLALALKRQHLLEMKDRYQEQRSSVVTDLGILTICKVVKVDFDLQSITKPSFLSEQLYSEVAEIVDVEDGLLHQAGSIWSLSQNLSQLIAARNEWIDEFQKFSKTSSQMKQCQRYFGLPTANGEQDEVYKDLVENISTANDDLIFLSFNLCGKLIRSALKQRRKFSRRLQKSVNVSFVDFRPQMESGLFPETSEYADWTEKGKIEKRKRFENPKKFEQNLLKELGL